MKRIRINEDYLVSWETEGFGGVEATDSTNFSGGVDQVINPSSRELLISFLDSLPELDGEL